MELSDQQLIAEAIETNHAGVGKDRTLDRYRDHLVHYSQYLASVFGLTFYSAKRKHVRMFMNHLSKPGGPKPHDARLRRAFGGWGGAPGGWLCGDSSASMPRLAWWKSSASSGRNTRARASPSVGWMQPISSGRLKPAMRSGRSTMDARSGLSPACCPMERRSRRSTTTLTATTRPPFGSFPPGDWIRSRWAALPFENDVCLLRPRRRHRLVPDWGIERCRQRARSGRPAGLRPGQPPARRNRGLGCQHASARQHPRSVACAGCRAGCRCLDPSQQRPPGRSMGVTGLEPVTSSLSSWRSPN